MTKEDILFDKDYKVVTSVKWAPFKKVKLEQLKVFLHILKMTNSNKHSNKKSCRHPQVQYIMIVGSMQDQLEDGGMHKQKKSTASRPDAAVKDGTLLWGNFITSFQMQ